MRSSLPWLAVGLLLCVLSSRVGAQDVAVGTGFADCLTEKQLARARTADSFAAFRSSNVPAPPLFWLASDRTFAMAAMLYWYKANPDKVSKLHLLLPLMYYRCTPSSRTLGSWLLGYRRDQAGFAGYFGPLFVRRDHAASTTALFPLFLRSRDHGHHTLTLLNVYRHETASGKHSGILPLAVWGTRGEYVYRSVLPPLGWYSRDRAGSVLLALPFYRKHRADGAWWSGVLPLYFGVRDGARQRDVLFPLFWRLKGRDWRSGLLAQSYWIRGPDRHSFGSFPFYLGYRDKNGGTADLVLPPLFARWGDRKRLHVWSLTTFWTRKASGDYELVVFPLFVAKRDADSRSLYTPLGFRVADAHSSSTLLGPLYRYRNQAGDHHTGVIPLYAQGADARHRYLALPLLLSGYGRERDRYRLVLGPFFFRRQPNGFRAGLPPIYIAARMNQHEYVDVVPPLLLGRWGDGVRSGLIAGPVYARLSPQRKGWGVLPLYAQVHTAGHHFNMFTPLVTSWRSATTRATTVFPLAFYKRTPSGRRFASPLLFTYTNSVAGQREITVPPLLWLRSSPDKQVGVFAPFWWRFHWKAEGKRLGVLFPLGLRYETAEQRTVVALNTAYTRSATKDAWSFHFFPLLSLSRFGPDHFKWQLLTGLLGREHDASRARWRALWVWTEPS